MSEYRRHIAAESAEIHDEWIEALDAFEDAWLAWSTKDGDTVPVHADWERSLLRFGRLGLRGPTIRYFVQRAMTKDGVPLNERWIYFCGCCWREIEKLNTEVSLNEPTPERRRFRQLADGSVWVREEL